MTRRILHQTKDNFWEVRSPLGLLLAVICLDKQGASYYVSASPGDSKHFKTFAEAARYAEVTP